MQILGLLGMYFDAVVVEVKTFFTFIQIGSGHAVRGLVWDCLCKTRWEREKVGKEEDIAMDMYLDLLGPKNN